MQVVVGIIRWAQVSLCALIASVFVLVGVEAVQDVVDLSVNVPLFGQAVALEDVARYTLHRMLPSTPYEVRVSYPASVRPVSLWPDLDAQHSASCTIATSRCLQVWTSRHSVRVSADTTCTT